jgi:hypothetical protein
MEGETTHAKQFLVWMCSFSFLGRSDMPNTYKRKTNRVSWTQEDLQSAGEAFLEKLAGNNEEGQFYYKLPLIFTLPALIIYARTISFCHKYGM